MSDEAMKRLAMVYSHWVAAGAIRAVVTASTRGEAEVAAQLGKDLTETAKMLSAFYRVLVFYALLYVVVEAYREQDEADRDPRLDMFLDDPHTDKLRRLRNAVFHVQNEPLNPKLWDFLLMPESETWIKKLDKALEQYLRSKFPIDAYVEAMASPAKPDGE